MSDAFQSFGSLAHLYLYDNKIMEMAGFSQLPQLESLHLSGNRIRRIADLKNSFNLRQLYLGQNEIEVIEGLENLSMLVELHIEHQRLPSEQSIIFSPNSLDTISRKLKVLNTSGNQLESIEDLLCMDVLDTLNLSRNRLTNLEHTSQVLRTLGQLRILDLRENRILKNPKYKEQIVGFCSGIEVLDEKDVNDTQRKTLQRMCAIKALRNQKQFQSTKTNPVHPVSSFPGAFRSVHRDQNVMQSRSVPVVMPLSAAKIYDEPFVFSTPISMSPTPDQFARMVTLPYDPASEGDVNTSEAEDLYAATRSSIQPAEEIESDSMSEMAKIIFRLSNLSPSNDNIGRARRSNHSSSHYWNVNRGFGDRFSTLKESRPLSPLEVEVPQSAMSKTQQNLGSVGRRPARRPMTRKLPPRKSMGAGRTLSPLEELPTPDSTVRDQLEGRSDWTSLQPWTTSLPQLLPRNKRVVGFAASDSKLMK
ncbi:protein phosphatase 1 regulatory subunit 7-like [Folsomia candida]|nr:protein phosphatase 1 regulatory subunit 7-like [Folsomia candida]